MQSGGTFAVCVPDTSYRSKTSISVASHLGNVAHELINYSQATIRCLGQFTASNRPVDRGVYRDSFATGIAFRLFHQPGHSNDPDRLTIGIVPMAGDANYSRVPIRRILGQIIHAPVATENA